MFLTKKDLAIFILITACLALIGVTFAQRKMLKERDFDLDYVVRIERDDRVIQFVAQPSGEARGSVTIGEDDSLIVLLATRQRPITARQADILLFGKPKRSRKAWRECICVKRLINGVMWLCAQPQCQRHGGRDKV